MRLRFTKLQGLGNDFVLIDSRPGGGLESWVLTPEIARRICDRRFGVGCDQILWLRGAPVRMEIFNPDGSQAEMCGNGIRAVAVYLERRGGLRKGELFPIETLAGEKSVRCEDDGQVAVDMGAPTLGAADETLAAAGATWRFFEIGMGNPHAVIFVDDLSRVAFEAVGPVIETAPRFPRRTNVEFVHAGAEALRVRVWERGAGLTLACGTGACASAVAAILTGRAKSPVRVELPGGALSIAWAGAGQSVWMTGPAEEVFSGEIDLGS